MTIINGVKSSVTYLLQRSIRDIIAYTKPVEIRQLFHTTQFTDEYTIVFKVLGTDSFAGVEYRQFIVFCSLRMKKIFSKILL